MARVGTGLACEAQLCWWRREKSCENKKQDSRDPGPGAIGGLASLAWAGKMCQQRLVAGDLGVATGAGLLFESRPAAHFERSTLSQATIRRANRSSFQGHVTLYML